MISVFYDFLTFLLFHHCYILESSTIPVVFWVLACASPRARAAVYEISGHLSVPESLCGGTGDRGSPVDWSDGDAGEKGLGLGLEKEGRGRER